MANGINGEKPQPKPIQVHGFVGSALIVCPSPCDMPVMVPIVPTIMARGQCPDCGTQFIVTRIAFNVESPTKVTMDVGVEVIPRPEDSKVHAPTPKEVGAFGSGRH